MRPNIYLDPKKANLENYADLKVSYIEELNAAFSYKNHLSIFIENLKENKSFEFIKPSLTELSAELKNQLEMMLSIYLLSGNNIPEKQYGSEKFNLMELMIMESEPCFNVKRYLLLLTYLNMSEAKEKISFKKLKSLAQICNYKRAIHLLNRPDNIIINYKKVFDRIAGSIFPAVA